MSILERESAYFEHSCMRIFHPPTICPHMVREKHFVRGQIFCPNPLTWIRVEEVDVDRKETMIELEQRIVEKLEEPTERGNI